MNANKVVKKLEEHYNITLKKVDENENPTLKLELLKGGNYYTENERGEILKLNLSVNVIDDIGILQKNSHSITHLNLSNNRLANIQILSRFKNLKFLNLSTNLISDINAISGLKNLQYLYLDDNKITQIPVLNLQNLSELKIFNNQITNITNLSSLLAMNLLDLSFNAVENITSIFALNNLIDLKLDNNKVSNLSGIENLKSLTKLSITANIIKDLSVFIKIKRIDFLNLSDNNIDDITFLKNIEIDKLTLVNNKIFDLSPLYNSLKNGKIKFLNVSGNDLIYPPSKVANGGEINIVGWFDAITTNVNTKIANAIEEKKVKIDLGNMGITDLSLVPKLFEFENLEELILSNVYAEFNLESNEWEPIPSKNNFLKNNIYNIPYEISKLINLKKLIIGGDWNQSKKWKNRWRIVDMNPITKLDNLEYLNLSNNQIEKFTITRNLPKLKTIHINNNNIKSISVSKALHLEYLFVSNNYIKSVDFLKKSDNIKSIDLHSNLVLDLNPIKNLINKIGISDSQWLYNTISIYNNPLENPGMEVVQRGKEAVLRRMDANFGISLFKNNEVKLILVGNSEAGKTTLLQYLSKDENYKVQHPFTLWMNVKQIQHDEANLNIFDFGGHEYFHDTHHIFFTKNTLYFILWEKTTNQYAFRNLNQIGDSGDKIKLNTFDYPLIYWLDSIKHFIKDRSPENFSDELKSLVNENSEEKEQEEEIIYASTLVIQNKVNDYKDLVFLDNLSLITKYPFIHNIINVNLHLSKNLENLNDNLSEMIDKSKISTGGEYPVYYKNIQDNIKKLQNSDNSNESKNILTFNEFKRLCSPFKRTLTTDNEFLDIAYFLKDVGLILISKDESTFYLDLKHLSKQVIKLYDGLEKKGGILKYNEIKDKNLENFDKVLKMIIDFNMAFELEKPDGKILIFPLFLPIEPSKIVKLLIQDNLKPYRRIEYSGFMHKNIILHVFANYSKNIVPSEIDENTYFWKNGLIVKDKNSTVIIKFFTGDNENDAYIDLYNLDKDEVFAEKIKEDIMKININNNYEVSECVAEDGVNFIPLSLIHKNEQKNLNILYKNHYFQLSNFKKYFKNKNLMKKIFISYSKYDDDYKKEFVKHLISLKDENLIDPFNCDEIELGDNSHEVIQKKLEECDYMIALVSVDFLNTKYIREFEIDKAEELEKKIIPIIIKPCDWESSKLGKHHASLRGNNISLDKKLLLNGDIKETSPIERAAFWTAIIKEFREKLFK